MVIRTVLPLFCLPKKEPPPKGEMQDRPQRKKRPDANDYNSAFFVKKMLSFVCAETDVVTHAHHC